MSRRLSLFGTILSCSVLFSGGISAEETARDQTTTVTIGLSDYPGWANLHNLPLVPTLAQDLRDAQKRLLSLGYSDQEKANADYIAGEIDLLAITNVDAFMLMAHEAEFPPSLVVLLTDVSLGADAVIRAAKPENGPEAPSIVMLQGNSVGSYLYSRAIDSNRFGTKTHTIRNVPYARAMQQFQAGKSKFVVLREPFPAEVNIADESDIIFDSSDIAGEVFGLLIMTEELARDDPELITAIQRGWFRLNEQEDDRVETAAARSSDRKRHEAISDRKNPDRFFEKWPVHV